MTPVITNASATSFQYGTQPSAGYRACFHGAVVFGQNLRFDAGSGTPIAGQIDRIELQSVNVAGHNTVHAIYADIAANAEQLNAAFADADTPWYDPEQFFGHMTIDTNTSEDIDPAAEFEFQPTKEDLSFHTGDVLTVSEIDHIFAAQDNKIALALTESCVEDWDDSEDDVDLQTHVPPFLDEINAEKFFGVDTENDIVLSPL